MPAPVERRRSRSESRWARETAAGDPVPTTARDAEQLVELRTAAPEFRASVEALAGVLQKRNGLAAVVAPSTLEASDAEEGPHTEPLGPEVAWTAAEGIMRVQALDLELRRMRRLNNRGAVNTENVRMLGVALKDAERAVSSFVGRSVTGEAMWKRGGPDKVEEREAKLDRYGPRRHEITVAARSRDA